jgi:hypothetical protein
LILNGFRFEAVKELILAYNIFDGSAEIGILGEIFFDSNGKIFYISTSKVEKVIFQVGFALRRCGFFADYQTDNGGRDG